MRRRIFLAINIPDKAKREITENQVEMEESFLSLRDHPSQKAVIRWTKKENIHITLVFLGYIKDEVLPEILKKTRGVVSEHASFSLQLDKIAYAPPGKMPPRMVWAILKESRELEKLQRELEDSLFSSSSQRIKNQKRRPYSAHLTLGRIRIWAFKKIEPEERPQVERELSSVFPVDSVEVMESQLKRTGAQYTVLESIPLRGQQKING